jgi:hypothetical protein
MLSREAREEPNKTCRYAKEQVIFISLNAFHHYELSNLTLKLSSNQIPNHYF